MKSIPPHRLPRNGRSPGQEKAPTQPIDRHISHAFCELRLHTEELALELAARLRVLGKSLAANCPKAVAEKRTVGSGRYTVLRRQFESFLEAAIGRAAAADEAFALVRRYLAQTLPFDLDSCGGAKPCHLEIVEAAISLLSDGTCEDEATLGGRKIGVSF